MLQEASDMQKRASSDKKKVRPESSSPSKLKERNSGNLKHMKGLHSSSEESDKYSDDGIKEDNEGESESKPPSKAKEDAYDTTPEDMKKKAKGLDAQEEEEEEEDEVEMDEEEMIDCAEKIFVRMADAMFKQKMTVR
jgi:hypothetical protein